MTLLNDTEISAYRPNCAIKNNSFIHECDLDYQLKIRNGGKTRIEVCFPFMAMTCSPRFGKQFIIYDVKRQKWQQKISLCYLRWTMCLKKTDMCRVNMVMPSHGNYAN